MARISVNPGVLQDASEHLRRAVAAAHDIRHERDLLLDLVGDSGAPRFTEAVENFLKKWSWGLGFMERDGKALANMLGSCAEAYVELEDDVAVRLGDG